MVSGGVEMEHWHGTGQKENHQINELDALLNVFKVNKKGTKQVSTSQWCLVANV